MQVPRCVANHGPCEIEGGQTDVGRINYFVYDQNGSSQGTASTIVRACHDGKYLYVNYSNVDTDVISTLKGCNSFLYTEDAVEFFVATGESYPYDYYEFEVSPKGELFFADIHNAALNCSKLGTQYKDCSLVQYDGKITAQGWDAWLKLDLTVIGRGQPLRKFYGNFFRIDKNAGKPTAYLCWQSTFADPPCFHKPKNFGAIELIG